MAQSDLRGSATLGFTAAELKRIRSALTTWPDARGWFETLAVMIVFTASASVLGLAGGVLGPRRAPAPVLPLVLRVLIVPGLLEELVFRVAPPPRFAGVALLAYVLMHPLNAWLFFPAAQPVFYNPVFLLIVTLLGVSCTLLYRRTSSVWPPTLFHGLTVAGWLLFLGGEAVLRP